MEKIALQYNTTLQEKEEGSLVFTTTFLNPTFGIEETSYLHQMEEYTSTMSMEVMESFTENNILLK